MIDRLEHVGHVRFSRTLPAILATLDRLEAETATSNAASDDRGAADTGRSERPTNAA